MALAGAAMLFLGIYSRDNPRVLYRKNQPGKN